MLCPNIPNYIFLPQELMGIPALWDPTKHFKVICFEEKMTSPTAISKQISDSSILL